MNKKLRASFKVKLKVNLSSGKQFHVQKGSIAAQVLDVSILGVGLLSKCSISKGIIVDLELKVNGKIIETKGEIRSSIPSDKGLTRIGIRFIGLKRTQLAIIKNFIIDCEKRAPRRMKLT